MKPLNLNASLSWTRVLPLLQAEETHRLPMRQLQCPACRARRLSIFQHPALGGQWHYCFQCGQRGNLLQLSARIWNLGGSAAVLKWAGLGCHFPNTSPPVIAGYLRWFEEQPARVQAVWDASCRTVRLLTPTARQLATRLKCTVNPTVSWNDEGVLQILGCLPADEIQNLLSGGTPDETGNYPVKGYCDRPHRGRIFKGREWGDVLIVPFYDLPGRISAYRFLGQDPGEKHQILCPADSFPPPGELREGGLAIHPELWECREPLVALRDLPGYLQLQCRGLAIKSEPARLVCWQQHEKLGTRNAWAGLASPRVVFWDTKLDAPLMQQVLRADGHLVINDQLRHPDQYLASRQSWELVSLVCELGKPWPQALANYFANRPDGVLEGLLLDLEAGGVELASLLDRCPAKFAQRARRLLQSSRPGSQVILDGRVIEERAGGWFLQQRAGQEERILNVIPRLDQMIWYPEAGEAFYTGRILIPEASREIPFTVARDTLEARPLRWLEDQLSTAGNVVLHANSRWGSQIVTLAKRFQEPVVHTGLETVGWQESRHAFVFPEYSLGPGLPPQRHSYFRRAETAPGRFPWPDSPVLSPLQQTMVPGGSGQQFWQAYIYLLALGLAPALRRTLPPVAIHADQPARAAAEALDCYQVAAGETPPGQHNWPVLQQDRLREPLSPAGALYELTLVPQAAAWAWSGSRIMPVQTGEMHFDPWLARQLRWVLPSFLQHLLTGPGIWKRLRHCRRLESQLRQEFNLWLRTRWGSSRLLPKKMDPDPPANWFPRLLYWMCQNGDATVVAERYVVEGAVWQGEAGVYVPKDLMLGCLREHGCRILPEVITRHLAADGKLIGETTKHGKICWLVPGDWVRSSLAQQHNAATRMIKLA